MKTSDEQILKLKEQIALKKETIKLLTDNGKPLTNLVIKVLNTTYNLNVLDKNDLLIIQGMISHIPSGEIYSGFPVSSWLADIKRKIKQWEIRQESEKLSVLEKRLDKLVSKELSDKIELDNIINEMKDVL